MRQLTLAATLNPTTPSDKTHLFDKRSQQLQQYECGICGYVYDPAKGDPEGNIPPNTPFDKLPEDWVCPICGASKDQFSPA